MKAKIELMNMDSDSGYVPSSGWTEAILVDAQAAARCGGDAVALYDLDGTQIKQADLDDVEVRSYRSGVCNYREAIGTYDVPEGKVVVQQRYESISTRDEADYDAWVVDPAQSLKELYHQRAKEYEALAQGS